MLHSLIDFSNISHLRFDMTALSSAVKTLASEMKSNRLLLEELNKRMVLKDRADDMRDQVHDMKEFMGTVREDMRGVQDWMDTHETYVKGISKQVDYLVKDRDLEDVSVTDTDTEVPSWTGGGRDEEDRKSI